MPDLWFYDPAEDDELDELDEHDDYDGPAEYLPEDIDDRYVVAAMTEAGAWRIEVAR